MKYSDMPLLADLPEQDAIPAATPIGLTWQARSRPRTDGRPGPDVTSGLE
jgi:hypothetical protein